MPAAGRGDRLGGATPKALRPLAGVPMLCRAVAALQACPLVGAVVVAVPENFVDDVIGLLPRTVTVVAGGVDRRASVAAALAALPAGLDVVLVHDAARPLAPPELVARVAEAVLAGAAAVVPAMAVTDTIKRVDDRSLVRETLAREHLRAVQTPQGFRRDVLEAAHARSPGEVTDDAGLVEHLGYPVLVVPGDARAMKVTTAADLVIAAALLGEEA